MRRALVCAAAVLGCAPAAQAAYAPRLDVRVEPATPGAAAALTATVTQASGEDATASEHVRFPPQFTFNPDLRVGRCNAEAERAARCPEDSRIGAASARTLLGDFSGPVFLTSDFRFAVFLRGLAGLVQQEFVGYLRLLPDGSVESVLEGLPNVPSTLARVAFEPGSRSLLLTPRACGTYAIGATFTGHGGARVERSAPVAISGCDAAPHIRRVTAAGDRRRRVRVAWTLSGAGSASVVEVDRLVASGRFVRRRRAARVRAPAREGANRVVVGPLAPGRYEVELTVFSAAGRPAGVSHATLTLAR